MGKPYKIMALIWSGLHIIEYDSAHVLVWFLLRK